MVDSPPPSPSQRWIRGSNAGQDRSPFTVHMLAWTGGCPWLVDGSFPFPFPRLVPGVRSRGSSLVIRTDRSPSVLVPHHFHALSGPTVL